MIHGILNIYKEAGFTSHDVAEAPGNHKTKKIGHTGTWTLRPPGCASLSVLERLPSCAICSRIRKSEYRAVFRPLAPHN